MQSTETKRVYNPIEIDVNMELKELTERSFQALRFYNDPERLFIFGALPVRIQANGLKELTLFRLKYELARAASFYRIKQGKDKTYKLFVSLPIEVCQDMLASPMFELPILKKIKNAPYFTAEGNIIEDPGYDERSQIYGIFDKGYYIIKNPNQEMIDKAKAKIDDLLYDFPFAESSDKSNAVALMLLPFCQEMIKGYLPLFLIEAPTAGTGKSLLVDLLTIPGLGDNISKMVEGNDDDEWRKRLTAVMAGNKGAIILDNINHGLSTSALTAIITSDVYTDRILGKSETGDFPNNSIWIATANNITASKEVARRIIRIRLNPNCENPFLRENFKYKDIVGYVKQFRHEFVESCLTLIIAWIQAGQPKGSAKPLGSFEEFTKILGGILDFIGYQGFLNNNYTLYTETDEDDEALRLFIAEWARQQGEKELTTNELLPIAKEIDGLKLGRSDNDNNKKCILGHIIAKNRDRVFNCFKIKQAGKTHNAKLWKLENSDEIPF